MDRLDPKQVAARNRKISLALVILVALALAFLLLRTCSRFPPGACANMPCDLRPIGCIPCPHDTPPPVVVKEAL